MLTFYFDDTFVIEQLDPDGKKFDKGLYLEAFSISISYLFDFILI